MIAKKTRVPNSSLCFKYNKEFDILDVFIQKVTPSISEENYYGIYTYFDVNTDEIVGVSIERYKTRDKKFIKAYLPFILDFDYIDRNIYN
jgi:hypothetical protein